MEIPSCSSRQVIRASLRLGFFMKPGGKGSHTKLQHRLSGRIIIVPETKDIGKGLRTKIVSDISTITGKNIAEVVRLLSMGGIFFLVGRLFRS